MERTGANAATAAFADLREALGRYLEAVSVPELETMAGYVVVSIRLPRAQRHFAILCLTCGYLSHNHNDVANKYCGHCCVFHEEG
jgi:hypothetical protein